MSGKVGAKVDLYPTSQPPLGTYPSNASRNNSNGTDADVLERFKVREICEGWPTYRDAAEWKNYRSMFHDNAYITTSWTQATIDDFIESSKEGFKHQKDFIYILHRMIGQTVDVQGNRAVSKMKVTITCRMTVDGIEMDNEADCRFFFLLEKRQGKWGVCMMTLLFDKDKMVPVNPNHVFDVPESELEGFPSRYRYLCWMEKKVGRQPKMDLSNHGPDRDILYAKCKDWLGGKEVKPNLTGTDVIDY